MKGMPFHSVRVGKEGGIEVLSQGGFSTIEPIPREPGVYQLRPTRRV